MANYSFDLKTEKEIKMAKIYNMHIHIAVHTCVCVWFLAAVLLVSRIVVVIG